MKRLVVLLSALLVLVATAAAGQFDYQTHKRRRVAVPRVRSYYRTETYPGKELLKRQIAEAEFRVAEAKYRYGTRSPAYKAARADLNMLRDRQRMENMLHRRPARIGGRY